MAKSKRTKSKRAKSKRTQSRKQPPKRRLPSQSERAAPERPGKVTAESTISSALRLQRSGQLVEAEHLYRQVLKTEPDNPDAWHLLGMTLFGMQKYAQAIECLKSTLTLTPNQPAVLTNLGVVYRAAGHMDAAKEVLERAAQGDSNCVNALNNLGTVYLELNHLEAAEEKFQKVLALKPDFSQAAMNLANLWQQQGKFLDAETVYRKLATRIPDDGLLLNNLGETLRKQSKWHEAVETFELALANEPENVDIRLNLGRTLAQLGRREEAKCHFVDLINQDLGLAKPHHYLGKLHLDQGEFECAANCLQRAVKLDATNVYALGSLGMVYLEMGEAVRAEKCFRTVVELDPSQHQAHSSLLFLMSGDVTIGQRELFEEHQRWGEWHGSFEPLKSSQKWLDSKRHEGGRNIKSRKLRIGYVSPDFRKHAVASFIEPVLEFHDRQNFETFCYAEVTLPDAKTNELREMADHWRSTVGMSDEQVARQILSDEIDILIDLAGHTARNRLRVFAYRPAPIQVTWIGYPNTTGLTSIDYRLTCETQNPIDEDSFHTERLLRMPSGSFCFARPKYAPTPSELPAIENKFITFGSLHRPEKISQATLGLWAGVLRSCPESRMSIFNTRFTNETSEKLINGLVQLGVKPNRLLIRNSVNEDHYFHAYDEIDIALDVTPWAGGTTTLEALWMGVPVIAYYGDRRSSRSTAAIMKNIGHASLTASSEIEYQALAKGLSGDIPRLNQYRSMLRAQVEDSLVDAAKFTSRLESCFRNVWKEWCDTDIH
jgi:predicted O-linked N-acetylglucosamine transferase (SPINDLY family)